MKEFLRTMTTTWWGILIICVLCVAVWILLSALLYRVFFKRFYDMLLSGIAMIVLSPLLLVLTIVGAIAMKGNPFFVQKRPGRRKKLSKKECAKRGVPYGTYGEEKIINLLKFRTMTNAKDADGYFLPDKDRLNKYGKFLRSSSLDEIPSILNIFVGSLSIVGPRPLLVKYLPYYTEEERRRHDVRPGLTGLAQVNGRNAIAWEQKFEYDLEYVRKVTLWRDLKIVFQTICKVLSHSGVSVDTNAIEGNFAEIRARKNSDMINILLLSVGTRNKIVKYFKKELYGKGTVVATDMSVLAPAIYEADKYYIVPKITDDHYLDKIFDICKKDKISGVLSLIDPELSLLAKNSEKFAELGVTVVGSTYALCERAFDKMQMYVWLRDNGYNCAKSYTDKEIFYSDLNRGEIKFPVFIKPIRGSASIAVSKVYDKESVENLFLHNDNLMIQEFLDGQEIGADVYIDMISHKVVSIFTKKKIAMRAGETDKAISFKDKKLFALIEKFVLDSGYVGQIDIDVFDVNGKYYISEVNPRFGGGYPHAYECGCNHMKYILNNLNGQTNGTEMGNYVSDKYMMKFSEVKVI